MNLQGNAAAIREACDAGVLSGAVTLVWQRGKVLQVNEIGYRDVEAGLPMQQDTLFRIASMTKPVTVAAVMSLVDEGRLALKDPIGRWTPELADVRVLDDPRGPLDRTHPARRAILIEDLLTPDEHSRKMGACMPLSELVIVPGASHLALLDKPETINDGLVRLVDRALPGPMARRYRRIRERFGRRG